MKTRETVWLLLLCLAIGITICFKYFPYLPGDVTLTRLVQSVLPKSKRWAQLMSSTAEVPWVLFLIVAAFLLSRLIAGWRGALLSLASFAGLWLLGKSLGRFIAQPRPSPELVQVTGSPSGSAFPSIFAFNYVSTVGFLAVLAAVKTSDWLRWAVVFICSALLLIGWIARVALAAHWPSDVGISYLIGLLWASLLVRFIQKEEVIPSDESRRLVTKEKP